MLSPRPMSRFTLCANGVSPGHTPIDASSAPPAASEPVPQAAFSRPFEPAAASRPLAVEIAAPVAVVNVMMIALALWLMRVGLREDRAGPFAAGVLYFLLWAVLRYADLFSGVGGMLGAAVMFLLCGRAAEEKGARSVPSRIDGCGVSTAEVPLR